jgi:predicted NUDIX family phosphoesterase
MSGTEENILVVPRTAWEEVGAFQGVEADAERYLQALLRPEVAKFLPRSAAEEDPSHKQIIPYVVFTWGDKVLRYWRGKSSGEARLHAKGSIGVGGHMNECDVATEDVDRTAYERAVAREILEELGESASGQDRIVGLLNDDSNAVGQVHLGVVHHRVVEHPEVVAAEQALQGLEWVALADLRQEMDRLETWSQLLVARAEELFFPPAGTVPASD